jgi:putative Mn2+ efflux pump MntP
VFALIVVALSVGLGNFGAATAIGIGGVDHRTRLKVVVVFGAFEGGVPIIGVLIGRAAAGTLGSKASLIGGAMLCAAGLYMLVSEVVGGRSKPTSTASGLGRLVVLAALLSIDNLVVGFGLGADRVSLVSAAIVLGVVSAILGLAGLELGKRLGTRAGRWSEALGGVVLVCVGAAIAAGA